MYFVLCLDFFMFSKNIMISPWPSAPSLHFVNCDNYIHLGSSHLYVNVVPTLHTDRIWLHTTSQHFKSLKLFSLTKFIEKWHPYCENRKKTGFNLILIVTYWSWKSVTVVSHIITSKLHNSQQEVISWNIFAIHFLLIPLNLFDLIFLMMQFCYFDFLWSQEKLLSLLCTAAAKYDLVNTKHHWPATVGGMSQNFHQKYRKTPIFLPHTGPRVSFIFPLANFVKIPLFFTRKLVLNVPAVSARHPIWRLSVDGLAASGACRGRSELSFPAITECQGTRDRVGFGNITQIDTQFYVHVLSHTEASCHQQWKKANI